ncbi:CTP synthase [Candidatus Dojkabacteria bacterium]|nr:CTP synthase [Candidatus Dojkabacteria bacterium]
MTKAKKKSKYIFVSGGVLSGLGKGVAAASLGFLIQRRGYKVGSIKCETYLNVDSGTINPIEHGDPFLCEDGLEADMDLGTYERFLGENMGYKNFVTMGQVYKTIIDRERNMGYDGKTVDAIPHIPEEIIRRIEMAGEGKDITLVELGGTAGEYQNVFNYEAARIMKLRDHEGVIHIHLSYVPVPRHLGEPKTKPTQLSLRFLNSAGIQPNFLILRSELEIDQKRIEKIRVNCNMKEGRIITNPDLSSIYDLPKHFADQELDKKILKYFGMSARRLDMKNWEYLARRIKIPRKKKAKIAICGKYFATGSYELADSYASLIEAIKHTSWKLGIETEILFVNTEDIEKHGTNILKKTEGVIVPIGWGSRGVEGKIEAAKFARKTKTPYLGLCYGLHMAAIEFARNVLDEKEANTTEVNPKTSYPVIHDIPFDKKYQVIKGEGTSMRLGAYECIIKKGTLLHRIYTKHGAGKLLNKNTKFNQKGDLLVSERHRHRFEFNNDLREDFEKKGFVFAGTSPDNFFVEMIELSQKLHPFFVATQAHPEYKSRPLEPHPIFIEFLRAAVSFGEQH